MAGYSNTPLLKKLGIKSGMSLLVLNAPANYWTDLGELPPQVSCNESKAPVSETYDFIHFFGKSADELRNEIIDLKSHLGKTGMLWVSWPKKASKVATDLSDGLVREIGLEIGLVDNKKCAVDEVWSGLRFVYRIKDR